MDRERERFDPAMAGLPRARGDGPDNGDMMRFIDATAPRTRGWTPSTLKTPADKPDCPAHAGMDPTPFRW